MGLGSRTVACLAAGLVLSVTSLARADEAPLAEALFQQGVAAMERGDFARACSLLIESQRLDPGGGTLLNIALCHERSGRIATAWASYLEAKGVAERDGRDDRVAFAEQHLRMIEPRLPRLAIALAETPASVRLELDGVELRAGAWAVPFPVDPGEHKIRVEAPGRRTYAAAISVGEGESRRLAVPALVRDVAPVTPPSQTSRGGTQRTVGWTLTGVGGAALVGTAVLGALAIGAESTADAACPGAGACADSRGLDASERASSLSAAATVTGIGGAVALAGGLVLLLAAPH